MRKLQLAVLCLLVALSHQYILADQIAITEDGRKVVLKDDGTWEYMQERKVQSTKSTQGSYIREGSIGKTQQKKLKTPKGAKNIFTPRPIDPWIGEEFVFPEVPMSPLCQNVTQKSTLIICPISGGKLRRIRIPRFCAIVPDFSALHPDS